MSRDQRVGLVLIALTVIVFVAHSTHGSLLVDACIDAGGRYVSEPPGCDLGGATAQSLDRVPQRRGAWLLALGPASVVGVLVYVIGRAALRHIARGAR